MNLFQMSYMKDKPDQIDNELLTHFKFYASKYQAFLDFLNICRRRQNFFS